MSPFCSGRLAALTNVWQEEWKVLLSVKAKVGNSQVRYITGGYG